MLARAKLVVLIIACLTLVSGFVQMIFPSFVLNLIGGDINPSAVHSFAIVGMFMLLFGGLMLNGILINSTVMVFWAGLQKLGAAIAVFVGVQNGVFSWLALLIALFDLFSAFMYWYYMTQMKDEV